MEKEKATLHVFLCNNCHEPLTKEEMKGKSIIRLYRGDNYCNKCKKALKIK